MDIHNFPGPQSHEEIKAYQWGCKTLFAGVAHADVHGSFANACIWGPRDHLPTHMLTRGFGLLLPFGSPYLLINVLIMLPICKMICSIQSVSREAQKLPTACFAHLQTCGRMMSTLATVSCFFLSPLHEVW